jgi:hypothetical protein
VSTLESCFKLFRNPNGDIDVKVIHELKSWVGLFDAILDGSKTHDLRVMDRDFRVGDYCKLAEWDPLKLNYTGRTCLVEITYITAGTGKPGHNPCAFSPYALHPAMGVLSIRKVEQ